MTEICKNEKFYKRKHIFKNLYKYLIYMYVSECLYFLNTLYFCTDAINVQMYWAKKQTITYSTLPASVCDSGKQNA